MFIILLLRSRHPLWKGKKTQQSHSRILQTKGKWLHRSVDLAYAKYCLRIFELTVHFQLRNCSEPQCHKDKSSKIKQNNFNTFINVQRHLQPSFSALKLFKSISKNNLVSLKECLITGFQGNMSSKPVQFVRALCGHISSL